jgi:transposase
MSPAYIAEAAAYFPGARVVFDAFHIMSRPQGDRQSKAARRVRRSRINMAGQALDKVRKDLARQGADLRGGLWALRGNAWTRNSEQQERRLTNGVMEAINGLLQLAKRIARGFRNFHYFRLAAYLKAGGLNLQAPRLLPT